MGTIDGITGKVDLNVYNGSMYDLQKLTIGNDSDNDEPQEKKTSPQPAQETPQSVANSKPASAPASLAPPTKSQPSKEKRASGKPATEGKRTK